MLAHETMARGTRSDEMCRPANSSRRANARARSCQHYNVPVVPSCLRSVDSEGSAVGTGGELDRAHENKLHHPNLEPGKTDDFREDVALNAMLLAVTHAGACACDHDRVE